MLFGWIRLLISFGRRRGRKDFYWPTLVLLFLSISCDFFCLNRFGVVLTMIMID